MMFSSLGKDHSMYGFIHSPLGCIYNTYKTIPIQKGQKEANKTSQAPKSHIFKTA